MNPFLRRAWLNVPRGPQDDERQKEISALFGRDTTRWIVEGCFDQVRVSRELSESFSSRDFSVGVREVFRALLAGRFFGHEEEVVERLWLERWRDAAAVFHQDPADTNVWLGLPAGQVVLQIIRDSLVDRENPNLLWYRFAEISASKVVLQEKADAINDLFQQPFMVDQVRRWTERALVQVGQRFDRGEFILPMPRSPELPDAQDVMHQYGCVYIDRGFFRYEARPNVEHPLPPLRRSSDFGLSVQDLDQAGLDPYTSLPEIVGEISAAHEAAFPVCKRLSVEEVVAQRAGGVSLPELFRALAADKTYTFGDIRLLLAATRYACDARGGSPLFSFASPFTIRTPQGAPRREVPHVSGNSHAGFTLLHLPFDDAEFRWDHPPLVLGIRKPSAT